MASGKAGEENGNQKERQGRRVSLTGTGIFAGGTQLAHGTPPSCFLLLRSAGAHPWLSTSRSHLSPKPIDRDIGQAPGAQDRDIGEESVEGQKEISKNGLQSSTRSSSHLSLSLSYSLSLTTLFFVCCMSATLTVSWSSNKSGLFLPQGLCTCSVCLENSCPTTLPEH